MKKRVSQALATCQNIPAERLLKIKKSKRDEVAEISVDAKTTGSVSKSDIKYDKKDKGVDESTCDEGDLGTRRR